MSAIRPEKLRTAIYEILKDADMSKVSAKAVRRQLESQFETDLRDRKAEVEKIILDVAEQLQGPEQESSGASEAESEDSYSPEEDSPPPKKPKKAASSPKKTNETSKKTMSKFHYLSDELEAFLGVKYSTRGGVVKRFWEVVRSQNLLDPKNKQYFLAESPEARRIFKSKRSRAFGAMKFMSRHILGTVPFDDLPEELQREEENKQPRQKKSSSSKSTTAAAEATKTKRKGGFSQYHYLSKDLANFLGTNMLSRSGVVKRFWQIIKERRWIDPEQKQFFFVKSDEARKIFDNETRLRAFSAIKYMNPHILEKVPDELVPPDSPHHLSAPVSASPSASSRHHAHGHGHGDHDHHNDNDDGDDDDDDDDDGGGDDDDDDDDDDGGHEEPALSDDDRENYNAVNEGDGDDDDNVADDTDQGDDDDDDNDDDDDDDDDNSEEENGGWNERAEESNGSGFVH